MLNHSAPEVSLMEFSGKNVSYKSYRSRTRSLKEILPAVFEKLNSVK